MLKRLFLLGLVAVLLHASSSMPILVFAQEDRGKSLAAKVKADVAKRGIGEKARVTVKLQDGSKLKGYISQAGEDSFSLTDSKTGQSRALAYQDVIEVKKPGGLSLAAKIGIGLGVALGALAIAYAIECGDDPFC